MHEPRAQRTLVKSPPELWAEVSDVDALARHLGEFGEIRITRLDPETTVAWEGDRACGTVALEPSGWGTKVTITAKLAEQAAPEQAAPEQAAAEPPAPEPVAEVQPEPPAPEAEPVAEAEPAPPAPEAEAPKVGFFARLFGRRRRVESVVEVEADVEAEVEPLAAEPEPKPLSAKPKPEAVAVEPEPLAAEPEPEPEPLAAEPEPEPLAAASEPLAAEAEPTEPAPAPLDAERAEAILTGVLDDLGSAHHRPFSRS
jgi:hypothetical protein